MKTQLSNLRSGIKNQILNNNINYSLLPNATSHVGHSGSSHVEVITTWNKIIKENPETLKINLKGLEIELKANWSLSRKSVNYMANFPKELLEEKFYLKPSKKETPYICINNGNTIMISNGKNSYVFICPSLIEIL